MRQHGFGEAELDRAKKDVARLLRTRLQRARQVAERRPCVRAAAAFSHRRAGARHSGRTRAHASFPPAITVAEVGAFVRTFLGEDNRVVLASIPEKEGVAAVTEAACATRCAVGSTRDRRGLAGRGRAGAS